MCHSLDNATTSIHRKLIWSLTTLIFFFVQATSCYAQSTVLLPRNSDRTIDLGIFKGKTFLQVMESNGDGIFSKNELDAGTSVTIVTAGQIIDVINQLDSRIGQRLFALFENGQDDFRSIAAHIQGKSVTPKQIRSALAPYIRDLKDPSQTGLALSSLATICLLASGSGTLVMINPSSYYYNVGYENPNVKSGRSFSTSIGRPIFDPSDRDYLGEMDKFLRSANATEAESLYRALFGLLTNSDPSNFNNMSPAAQVVATDFMTIYTAELDRHVMANLDLKKDPWEVDLGEVTLISNYGSPAGMVMKNGSLVGGTAEDYFGQGSTGSGIGDTRRDFTKMAKEITSYEQSKNPELIQAIVDLTPISDSEILAIVAADIFRRYLVFLNRVEFQDAVQSKSDDLNDAMVRLLTQIKADQVEITEYLKTH